MADSDRPLVHLARGVEELLRASADALASWQERARQQGDPVEQTLERLLRVWAGFAEANAAGALASLRDALQQERERWEQKAATDAAAARLRDLCEALLDLLGPPAPQARRPRRAPAGRRAPPADNRSRGR